MNDLFAQLYELFGSCYLEGFSDDLYDNGVYITTGIMLISSCILGILCFYVFKRQRPHTFRLSAWFLTVIVLCLINLVSAYTFSYSTLERLYTEQNQDLPYAFGNFAGFSLINMLWTFVFCVLVSLTIQLVRINTHADIPFRFRKSHK